MGTGLRLVKGLEPGVKYRLTLIDPLTGAETAGGDLVADADGNWIPECPGTPAWFPRPIYQDWLLVLTVLTGAAAFTFTEDAVEMGQAVETAGKADPGD
jgi:hypothetical protein